MRHFLLVLAMIVVSGAQMNAQSATESDAKARLQRESERLGEAIRKAESAHATNRDLGRLYERAGTVYRALGWYAKAEPAMRQALLLLEGAGAQEDLADAWSQMSVLHALMGDDRRAEKDALEGLRVREALGDPLQTALAWTGLAGLYYRERHFSQALEYAQRAMNVLGSTANVDADGGIAVRQVLGYALCENRRCGEAIPLLKDAVAIAKQSYGQNSLSAALETYALGFVAWRNKDAADASRWMAQGIAGMKPELGWGDALYVDALMQYEQLLKQSRQTELAAAVDRERKLLSETVDVRSITKQQGDSVTLGLR